MTGSVLVTGGLGYLGGRILRHLKDQDVDHLRATTRRPLRQTPPWAAGITTVQTDLDQPESLERACDGVDTVVHLAAMNAAACAADPQSAQEVNVEGTRNVAAAAERAGVRRLVYFSTAHVYSAPLSGRLCETSPTTNTHPYAATHRAAEDIVLQSSLPSLVFRLSNGFGAPVSAETDCWMLVVNDICRQVVTDRRIVLRGTGEEPRDFIPLSDVSRAISHFLGLAIDDWSGAIYNLGAGHTRSVLEMAELIARRCDCLLGFRPDIERRQTDDGAAPPGLDFRIDKLRETGFSPEDDASNEIDGTLRLCREAFG